MRSSFINMTIIGIRCRGIRHYNLACSLSVAVEVGRMNISLADARSLARSISKLMLGTSWGIMIKLALIRWIFWDGDPRLPTWSAVTFNLLRSLWRQTSFLTSANEAFQHIRRIGIGHGRFRWRLNDNRLSSFSRRSIFLTDSRAGLLRTRKEN